MASGMSYGTAPDESGPARLNIGESNTSHRKPDKAAQDVIRDEEGKIIVYLNFCMKVKSNLCFPKSTEQLQEGRKQEYQTANILPQNLSALWFRTIVSHT